MYRDYQATVHSISSLYLDKSLVVMISRFFFRYCTGYFCGSDCGDNTRDWCPSDDEKTAEGKRVGDGGDYL